jgi:hypothetical protein
MATARSVRAEPANSDKCDVGGHHERKSWENVVGGHHRGQCDGNVTENVMERWYLRMNRIIYNAPNVLPLSRSPR